MEKIDTDYKRQTRKPSAKLFKMRRPWRNSIKTASKPNIDSAMVTTKSYISLPITW